MPRGRGRNNYFCKTISKKYYSLPNYFRSSNCINIAGNKMYRTKLEWISDRLNEISYKLEFVMMNRITRARLEKELKELCEQRRKYIETLGTDE